MRFLYTTDTDTLFAYAPGRRDFFRAGDDQLWAHESHGWLVAAESGVTLAHRTGDVYYGAVDGERLYRVTNDAAPSSDDTGESVDMTESADGGDQQETRARRTSHRVARPRR
jgi:hypothetical protein